ncbi:MAG: hypothetical protein QXS81_05170 [Candidatus Micrarchaeaceae archaeon]
MRDNLLWIFQRVSAILLIVVLAIHFWFLHYEHPGAVVYYNNVASRLKTIFFLSVDSILLIAGLFHGLDGLNNILLDYGIKDSIRRTVGWFLTLFGLILMILGIYSLTYFVL